MPDQKTPLTPTTASPQNQNVEIRQTADYRQIYANNVAIRVTNWDFLLDFGKIISVAANSLVANSEVGVFLSPPQAKALLNSLASTISQYEAQVGKIPSQSK